MPSEQSCQHPVGSVKGSLRRSPWLNPPGTIDAEQTCCQRAHGIRGVPFSQKNLPAAKRRFPSPCQTPRTEPASQFITRWGESGRRERDGRGGAEREMLSTPPAAFTSPSDAAEAGSHSSAISYQRVTQTNRQHLRFQIPLPSRFSRSYSITSTTKTRHYADK